MRGGGCWVCLVGGRKQEKERSYRIGVGMRASGQPSAPARAGVVLATLILAAGIANINLAVANVAMPDIGQAFKASQTTIDLIAVDYLLGLAASVLYLGAVGDRYGRKLAPFAAFVVDAARAGETTWRNPTQYHLHGHPPRGVGLRCRWCRRRHLVPALDPRLRRSGRSRGRGGHLWHSMSRADVKEFGDLIDASRPPSSSAAGARSRQPSRWIS